MALRAPCYTTLFPLFFIPGIFGQAGSANSLLNLLNKSNLKRSEEAHIYAELAKASLKTERSLKDAGVTCNCSGNGNLSVRRNARVSEMSNSIQTEISN